MVAITQPIYPQQLNDPGKLCAVIEKEKGKSPTVEESLVQRNLYEAFLIKEVKKIFVANQLIVAFQPDSMPSSKKTILCNKLLSAGYSPVFYPEDVVHKAVTGTRWHNLCPLLLQPTMLVVSELPHVKDLVRIVSKIPEFAMLGGFVADKLLTREGLIEYSQLPTLTGLHVQLGHVLKQTIAQTRHLLTSQQTLLACNLDYHSSKHSLS